MIRYIVILVCLIITTFPAFSTEEEMFEEFSISTPDQIATLSSAPDFLVGGLISPLSGQPVLRQTDLIVKGAQEIILDRVYIPPYMPCSFPKNKKHQHGNWETFHLWNHLNKNYRGWQFLPHLRMLFTPSSREARFTDPHGATFNFRLSYSGSGIFATLPYAISNASGDAVSGKYDPRNTRVSHDHWNLITLYAPDGTIRFYSHRRPTSAALTTYLYLLEKEILPNGKVIKYHYDDTRLIRVESLDPKERYIYASIDIEGSPVRSPCHFTSSTGQKMDYIYHRQILPIKIREKKSENEIKGICPPTLMTVSSPFYRNETLHYADPPLLESFSGKNEIFTCHYAGFGSKVPHYRAHQLFFPVGQNDALQLVHELSYDPPIPGDKEGTTTVKNSDGTTAVHYFSKSILPTLIRYSGQDGTLKKEKITSWTPNHWLQSIEIKDGQGKLLLKKSYEYDRFGNPILEVFTGDLTGEGNQGTFTTKRTFSEDGRNLLLTEEGEDGKIICLSYLPNTNLVTAKLTKHGAKIVLREFSEYDDCNNLIQTTLDDGTSPEKTDLTGVTQRTITSITLRQQPPFLHMPEWIDEKYLEDGSEKLLKRTHLSYDAYGNVSQEEIYDANGQYAYTILKEYNERGTLISETNPLKQKATYIDDARGRITSATNFSNRLTKTLAHDIQGRLREQTETGDDDTVHRTFFAYDYHDRLIQKTDPFQNTTRYTYDALVNQVARTDFPLIASPSGEPIPVATSSTFDPLGNELTKTDANSKTTTYRYNAYGSPTEITYPDDSKEFFRYSKNGKLASHKSPDDLTLCYKHDVLGRILSKTYISPEGGQFAEERFTYSGFHLLTETDKQGHLTEYFYDGAGRKIREQHCGRVTDFSYNPLGQLSTVCKHNRDNSLLIHYQRDLLNRVTEENKTDPLGCSLYKITYSYDDDGNTKTITRYIGKKEAVDTFNYDPFQRLVKHEDPLGHTWQTIYHENTVNPLGQTVLSIATTDPQHVTTLKTQDALARLVRKEILNRQGAIISCQEMTHDPKGNLTYQQDHIYKNGRFQNTQTIQYTYTPSNQIESLTRAFGTKNARVTTYSYFPSGKIATKTLPDSTTLSYTYHPLNFLSRVDSSDGAIHHAFEYNLLGHLTSATDENQNIAIERKVNPFGDVIWEEFPCNFVVEKDYDDFGRLISLKMGREGEIAYAYDPLFLRNVIRLSGGGKTLYTHHYEDYDLDGNLLSENLIGDLGQVIHATDLKGQKTAISSPYFSQSCAYDARGDLSINVIDGHEHRYTYDDLSQLTSESQSLFYAHDSLYNRTQKNSDACKTNDLNELLSSGQTHCTYDLNGNQYFKKTPSEIIKFVHDPLNRLVEATTSEKKIHFVYDPLGRRLSKIVINNGSKEISHENYLYDGQSEIGAFSPSGVLKNLKVLGLAKHRNNPTTIAIELEGQVFAPLLDVQGNVRRLVDMDSRAIASSYDYTAFGEELKKCAMSKPSMLNPWRFAAKRWEPELGLIYFGKRDYDPEFARWVQTDPAGFIDSVNLYQYVFNNPFHYYDPDGTVLGLFFAVVIPLAEFALPIIVRSVVYSAVAAGVMWGCEQLQHQLNHSNHQFAKVDSTKQNDDDYSVTFSKRHTPDQEAISELVKESGKKGVSNADADTLLDWSEEYDFPARDDREAPPHWVGGKHIHVGPKHIKVYD
ncbi:MAG: RHS repeat-associated core domain-containing protein [Rhabdochlamydiaceae bacterium]|jgi:RHS repeat-associated protein